MKKIALVTSKKWYRRCREDLYLEQQLFQADYLPEIVSWTDSLPWESYDLVILRSAWDYYQEYNTFCAWLQTLRNCHVPIANGADRIIQNINKPIQLQQLVSCPTPPILSQICSSIEEVLTAADSLTQQQLVIKPGISASGHNTFLIDRTTKQWECHLQEVAKIILNETAKAIVQPFMPAIFSGETSLIFFCNLLSHGVVRFPGVLGQRQYAIPLKQIPSKFAEAGRKVLEHIGNTDLLYARIDMIEQDGQIYVMEVELAEPDLYLSLNYPDQEPPILHFLEAIRQFIL